jgi:hypothetical protein
MISLASTQSYPSSTRQLPRSVQRFMHAVNCRRESSGRKRTQTASPGHVPGSQPNSVHAPLGVELSHARSPVSEQSSAVSHESPIVGAQPAIARLRTTSNDLMWGASIAEDAGGAREGPDTSGVLSAWRPSE